jgi:hypothetical protein
MLQNLDSPSEINRQGEDNDSLVLKAASHKCVQEELKLL